MLSGEQSKATDEAWSELERQLRRIQGLGQANQFDVGVVTMPMYSQVASGASPLLYQGRIRTVAVERLGLFVADPLPGFLAQPDRTTLFILFYHAHFSRVGYAEVASVAADALRSRFDALPRPVDLLTSTTAVGAPGTPAAPVAPVSPAVPTVR